MKKRYSFGLSIVVLILFLLQACAPQEGALPPETPTKEVTKIVAPTTTDEIKVLPDGTKYLVHPNKLRGGGPPKDGIPSIDNPQFESIAEADKHIGDEELIFAMTYKGVSRGYPVQIMVWHEIVNEIISGDPILITWCPLCGTGLAFERIVNGKPTEFGVSGKLFNSNLVMYDRQTDTYWEQSRGLAIVGDLSGQKLKRLPLDTIQWKGFKEAHPNAQVLSRDTGALRSYGVDPYGDYYESRRLIFPVENTDDSIHPKEVIWGLETETIKKAYLERDLEKLGTIEDSVGDLNLKITRDKNGQIIAENVATGEEIVLVRSFWFSWYNSYPSTEVYSLQ